MATEIQDKQITGITGKLVAGALISILAISSSFWVGYYKVQNRFDTIENKREFDLLINKQVVEGVKQNDNLQDIRLKSNEDRIQDLENKMREWEMNNRKK